MKSEYETLEIAITDFCNLDCALCSQATPEFKDKRIMKLDELRQISRHFKPHEFHTIKISGGEPTMHPQFSEICGDLKELFPAKRYILETNGFRLKAFEECLKVFDLVDLSCYQNKNEEECRYFRGHKFRNVSVHDCRDYVEMADVLKESNLHKEGIYAHCEFQCTKKIVQGRIYACCVVFGLAVRKGIGFDQVSVPASEQWRAELARIDLEPHCRRCFVDVNTKIPFFWTKIWRRCRFFIRKLKNLIA